MKSKTNTFQLALAGMLIAIGIVIPMFSPIKIIIEPASFTLASHVPVFIAMFISPMMAAAVALGTTLGFLLGGLGLLGLGGLAPLPAAAATAAGRRADCLRMFVVWHKIPSLSQAGQARRAVSPSGCGTRYNSVFPRRGPC